MSERILIIGGDAAGMSAASRIVRVQPNVRVTVLEREGVVSYGACGMPYHLDGRIPNQNTLLIRSPSDFAELGIDVRLHHEAVAIDPEAGKVTVRRGDGAVSVEPYDQLLIATGATPIIPPVPGVEAANVFVFRRYDDLTLLSDYLEGRDSARITIVGGGYIGVELADVLMARGLSVTLVEMSDSLFPRTLDSDMARIVEAELRDRGADLRLGSRVAEFGTQDGLVHRVLTQDEAWNCDVVILASGTRPAADLAREAGIALDGFGAVATNSRLRASLPNVWAAGDCTSTVNLVTGQPAWVPLGPAANKQGRVVGSNLAGSRQIFGGVVGTALAQVCRLAVGRTGLTEMEAVEAGLHATTTVITAGDRAPYYPGGEPTTVKIIAETGTGRLLGAQIVGRNGVPGRTNVIATALHANMTIDALASLDLGYAPPFSPVWDPLLVAANTLLPKVGTGIDTAMHGRDGS
ncbi:FAD-dependent oxidoreductase [Nocardia vinacea]|uniref:FAD-dependent oxidoreductase n=1 Tax=Nocardia vinacea TaxID=96468 RepID=A0ABZ1YR70_9NOCA|nr:FAD-dependent oxidoreductase [Nocardia vinacea]